MRDSANVGPFSLSIPVDCSDPLSSKERVRLDQNNVLSETKEDDNLALMALGIVVDC